MFQQSINVFDHARYFHDEVDTSVLYSMLHPVGKCVYTLVMDLTIVHIHLNCPTFSCMFLDYIFSVCLYTNSFVATNIRYILCNGWWIVVKRVSETSCATFTIVPCAQWSDVCGLFVSRQIRISDIFHF